MPFLPGYAAMPTTVLNAFLALTREAELVVISDDAEALRLARVPLALPAGVPEWLSPITAIIPAQMFAMYLAHTRDFDVDQPRGLNKVTETW